MEADKVRVYLEKSRKVIRKGFRTTTMHDLGCLLFWCNLSVDIYRHIVSTVNMSYVNLAKSESSSTSDRDVLHAKRHINAIPTALLLILYYPSYGRHQFFGNEIKSLDFDIQDF